VEDNIQKCIFGIIFMLLAYLLIETRMASTHIKDLTHKMDTLISGNGISHNKEMMNEVSNAYILPGQVVQMYQAMKDTDEILAQHKILYWVNASTLLGTVRNQGIIPWDFTHLNICITGEQEQHFWEIKRAFEVIGYTVLKNNDGYKIIATGAEPVDAPIANYKKYPLINVFVAHKVGDKIIYNNLPHRHSLAQSFFLEEELFPLTKYKFGAIEVWGAKNPFEYLDRYYGDWEDYGLVYTNKYMGTSSPYLRVRLLQSLKKPAMPLGPLENRVRVKKNHLPLSKTMDSLREITGD
jgi:lipopolysaccharide cholinephosphotransferase